MQRPTEIPDSALVSYGLLAGGVRVFVPPVLDLPFVRTVRGAMFDRLSRVAGVTLTLEARRILVDLEEPTTGRGIAEQAIRWVAGRIIPAAPAIDAVRNILRTYAAGVLYRNYLHTHRDPKDPVLTAAEADRVREALRAVIEVASLDHLRAMGRMAAEGVQLARRETSDLGFQGYTDLAVSTIAELPLTWVMVMDERFVQTLRRP